MKIKKYLPHIILIALFLLTLLVSLQIGLFGDDYFYITFTKGDFWELQKEHYLHSTGRAIIAFLNSILLAIPLFYWAILNSLMLTRNCIFWK